MVKGMEKLDELVKKFNQRAMEDERLSSDIADLKRDILLNFKDDGKFYLHLENSRLEFVDPFENPDIEIEMDMDTFNKILSKELDALSAYITKRIVVRASLRDKLLLSDLLKA